jgi:phage terminase large subunit-like protein
LQSLSETPFYQYVEGVISGKEIVGKLIRLAVERFVRDCDKKDYTFDYNAGYRIIEFARLCNHWKGPKAGTPLELDPHQHFYLIQKYGWIDPNTGLPRFSSTYKEIARKTGKTTEGAVEGIFHMTKGIEEAAQVWTCATKEDDAIIIVNDAGRIIEASPLLKNRFKLQIRDPYVRRVIYPKRQAFMAYMTKGQDAVDTSMGIGDECHDWPTAAVKQRIESSMGNRIAPSFTNMTTAGFNKETYCFNTLRDTGIKILEGVVKDENQLIMIFELDEGDDWQDETVWVKSNPNIPFSTTHLRNIKKGLIKAINEGGSTEVNFKTKNLNIWVDAPATFIPAEVWNRNNVDIQESELVGRVCFGGLEVGASGEISALSLLFPGEKIHIKMLFMIASEAIEGNDVYQKNKSFLKIDPGNELDNDVAVAWIIEELQKYQLDSFCFPSTHKTNSIVQGLIKRGYVGNPLGQGVLSLSSPTEEWEKVLKAENINHFQNPILAYHNSNCMVVRKQQGIRVEKNAKVLGVYACINALAQWKTITAEEIIVETNVISL